jgi:conjugative relaxase-like TrwC/TraI family protein
MLTIHTATSAASVKAYFDMADYYSEGQETVGRWGGELAERLGLCGSVDKASFDALCDNLHPQTGESLTQRTNEFRRVGYDFVFSGPKSFSIVEALAGEADRQLLLNAFDAAVRETMEEMQGDMQVRVRKGGAQHDRPTRNMAWAEFDHSTARPVEGSVPDMHRHRHCFVFNATFDPVEREIKAGEFSYLKRDGEYYVAAFYSRLAGRLEGLGYRIDRQGGKKWEIAGVPQAVIERFSKRTVEVEAEAERLGLEAGKEKAGLGAKTRSKKDKELTPAELRRAWLDQLTDDERDALARVYGKGITPDQPVTAEQAVAFAIAHLSEQQSVFPERELKRVALLHGLGDVTPGQIAAELPNHGVIAQDLNGRRMATTAALQEEERFIVGFAARGRGAACPVGVADGLTRTLADGRVLNDGQWAIAQGLLESSNRVEIFEGPAGAGKSFSLKKYDEGMRLAGSPVSYLATTSKAVKVLEEDGFTCHTVAHFLKDEKMQAAASGGRLVIDETSMLGHKDTVTLLGIAERQNLKLVFVGDDMQHGSVARGALLRVLKDYAGIKPHRLEKIMRQADPEYRMAAQLFSEGKMLEGFAVIDKKEWVKEISDDAERYRAMAADYVETVSAGATCLVVSPTHAEAAAITAEIRRQLRQAGKLGGDEREFSRLVAVNASEAERGQVSTFRPGDVLQFHQNAKGGFVRGQRLTVANPAAVPVHLADKFSLYRPQTVTLAAGDIIRFTGNVKAFRSDHTYKNGDTATIAEFTPGNRLRLDDGRIIAADAGHFRSAFVETSFGAQGQTVKRVILGMAEASLPATNAEQLYVSSTRAKESMALYTDDKAAVRAAIQRSSQKLAALDVQPAPEPVPQPKVRLLHQKHLERQRRLLFASRRRTAAEPDLPPPPQPEPERKVSYGRG